MTTLLTLTFALVPFSYTLLSPFLQLHSTPKPFLFPLFSFVYQHITHFPKSLDSIHWERTSQLTGATNFLFNTLVKTVAKFLYASQWGCLEGLSSLAGVPTTIPRNTTEQGSLWLCLPFGLLLLCCSHFKDVESEHKADADEKEGKDTYKKDKSEFSYLQLHGWYQRPLC